MGLYPEVSALHVTGADRPLHLFRLYHVNDNGGIEAVSIIEAAGDTEAIKQAEELLQTSSGELWLEQRIISNVRAHRSR